MNMIEKPRSDPGPSHRKALAVLAAAFGLGSLFLALVLLLGSCSSRFQAAISAQGSARIEFQAEMPAPIAAKLRKLASAGGSSIDPSGPLFDLDAMRASIAARPELGLAELSRPSPDSVKGSLVVKSLARLAASPDLADSKALAYSEGPGWAELRLKLARGPGNGLESLLPGLDPYLLEALSPPALEEEGLSAEEYRMMLASVFGEKAMPAWDAAAISLELVAPEAVLSSGGGELSGRTLKARIPVIEALVLEEPIELWLRWKR